MSWSRVDEPERAADRLLDVAETVFADLGPARATVSDVARAAGCSRQTVHRYFATGDALRLAFVERESRSIQAKVATRLIGIDDPVEMIVTAALAAVDEVASRPALRRWFEPDAVGTTVSVSKASGTIAAGVADLWTRAGRTVGREPHSEHDRATAVDGLRRLMLSLLTDPPPSRDHTERLVRAMVVPMLLADSR